MRWFKFFLPLLLVLSSAVKNGNAQTVSGQTLRGAWQGQMVTNFEGQVYRSPLFIQFGSNHEAVFRMAENENGRYQADRNSIRIFLDGKSKEPILLYNIHIYQKGNIRSDIRLPLDPPGLTSTIHLVKIKGKFNLRVPSRVTCSPLETSEKVRMVLNKYGLPCPISVSREPNWYEYTTIKRALREAIEVSLNFIGQEVDYKKGRFVVVIYGPESEEIKKIAKTLVQDPERLFFLEECRGCGASTGTAPIGDLKADFVSGNKINFGRIWSTILSSAETVEGVKIDLKSQKQDTNKSIVRTKVRRLPTNDSGFIIAEQIIISMEDISNRWRGESAVGISVISNILRRGVSERQWVEINLGAHALASRQALFASELEHPCMHAILKSIKK